MRVNTSVYVCVRLCQNVVVYCNPGFRVFLWRFLHQYPPSLTSIIISITPGVSHFFFTCITIFKSHFTRSSHSSFSLAVLIAIALPSLRPQIIKRNSPCTNTITNILSQKSYTRTSTNTHSISSWCFSLYFFVSCVFYYGTCIDFYITRTNTLSISLLTHLSIVRLVSHSTNIISIIL